jgi:exodeoxyribonuclease VII small subunit
VQEKSFESRLEEAKQILEKLMNPELTLEQSVKAYESGTKALKEAQQMLEDAREQIEKIRAREDDES